MKTTIEHVFSAQRFEGVYGAKINKDIAFEEALLLSSFMCKASQVFFHLLYYFFCRSRQQMLSAITRFLTNHLLKLSWRKKSKRLFIFYYFIFEKDMI